jgi:putative addiction module component (TIGR02574 family)
MNKALWEELLELSPGERLQLVQDLWDSIEAENLPELTTEQIEEAERELAAHRADPDSSIPWEDVREWLWSRIK